MTPSAPQPSNLLISKYDAEVLELLAANLEAVARASSDVPAEKLARGLADVAAAARSADADAQGLAGQIRRLGAEMRFAAAGAVTPLPPAQPRSLPPVPSARPPLAGGPPRVGPPPPVGGPPPISGPSRLGAPPPISGPHPVGWPSLASAPLTVPGAASAASAAPAPPATSGQLPGDTFKREMRSRADGLVREAEAARERAKYLASPEGTRALREQRALSQDLGKALRAERWQEQVALQGQFAARLSWAREEAGKLGQALDGTGRMAGGAFFGMSAGILALTRSANPVAFDTFRASVEGLAISVGGSLGPGVIQVSGYIQQMAGYVDRLDPAFKSTAASVALWTTGLLGASYVVTRLVGTLRLLGPALAFTRAHPVLLGLTAIGGAVAYLTDGFGLLRDRARAAGDAMGEAGRARVEGGAGGGASPRDVLTPADFEGVRQYGPEWRRRVNAAMGNPAQLRQVMAEFGGRVEADTQTARERSLNVGRADVMDREVMRMQERERERLDREVGPEFSLARIRAAHQSAARVGHLVRRLDPDAPFDRVDEGRVGAYIGRVEDPRRPLSPINPGFALNERVAARAKLAEMVGLPAGMPGAGRSAAGHEPWQPWAQGLLRRLGLSPAVPGEGGAGGPGGVGLSLRSLPQPRGFDTAAGYAEFLQQQALQPMGDQDIKNELEKLNNMAAVLGKVLDGIKDNTARVAGAFGMGDY
jgi:hypothetical protein